MIVVHGKSRALKTLRCCLWLSLFFAAMEHWAQWRFSQNATFLPANIRRNIAMNSLDAFRLKPSYCGVSKNGMSFTTDEFGFRTATSSQSQTPPTTLLLGGDSRVFGYALPWQETLAALLNKKEHSVRLQAFPGSSPAMFNHQLFEERLINKLNKIEHVIYGYDPFDVYNDQTFMREIEKEKQYFSLRRLKVFFGGYAYTLLRQKLKAWQSKLQWQPNWWEHPTASPVKSNATQVKRATTTAAPERVNPISKDALLKMKQECQNNNLSLCLFYCPRMLELMQNNTRTKDRFVNFCLQNEIEYIDFFSIFKAYQVEHRVDATHWFLDPHEGIHYAKSANDLISNHIIEWLR